MVKKTGLIIYLLKDILFFLGFIVYIFPLVDTLGE